MEKETTRLLANTFIDSIAHLTEYWAAINLVPQDNAVFHTLYSKPAPRRSNRIEELLEEFKTPSAWENSVSRNLEKVKLPEIKK